MARTEQKTFTSSATSDILFSEIVEHLSSQFDNVETDSHGAVASFQRRFEFPGDWTDITNLEIQLQIADAPHGSTAWVTTHVQTNNLMNNTPWQVSRFVSDCTTAIETIAHNAMARY